MKYQKAGSVKTFQTNSPPNAQDHRDRKKKRDAFWAQWKAKHKPRVKKPFDRDVSEGQLSKLALRPKS